MARSPLRHPARPGHHQRHGLQRLSDRRGRRLSAERHAAVLAFLPRLGELHPGAAMAVRHTIKGRIGSYTGRTIIDEFGAPMTTGINYLANHNGAHYQSYFAAVTDLARSDGIGTAYWAGLKTGDSFSMEAHHRSGLVDNNSPGATQLRWGYGGLSGPQVPGMPDRRLFPGPAGDAGKYGVCPSDAGHRTSDCGGRRYDGTRPGEGRRWLPR